MPAKLRQLLSNDSKEAWERAGFFVLNNTISFPMNGKTSILPNGMGESIMGGLTVYKDGLSVNDEHLNGRALLEDVEMQKKISSTHPNGTIGIDHIVIQTNSIDRFKQHFKQTYDWVPKRERKDLFPGMIQLFYKEDGEGEPIIEVVGSATGSADEDTFNAHIWGITMLVEDDLSKAQSFLGDKLSRVKKAKQGKGRLIATVRHEQLGLKCNLALITKAMQSKI